MQGPAALTVKARRQVRRRCSVSISAPPPALRCEPLTAPSSAARCRSGRADTTAVASAICASAPGSTAWRKSGRHRCRPLRGDRRHLSTDAAHVHGGLLATLTAWCEQHDRLPGRPRRHDQALHRRQGQRRQGGRDRRGPRARVQPRRRQRSRRHRNPAVGDRDHGGSDGAPMTMRLPDRRFAETVSSSTTARGSWSRSGSIRMAAPARCSPTALAAAPTSTRCWPTPASWCRA